MLELEQVSKEFPGSRRGFSRGAPVQALKDVSLNVAKGESFGLVGESGSGKSVSCLSVMRLIPNPPGNIAGGEIIYHDPEKGAVDLLKLSIDDMRKYRGNKISMIFQEPMTSLNPVFTCGYQVDELWQWHANPKYWLPTSLQPP